MVNKIAIMQEVNGALETIIDNGSGSVHVEVTEKEIVISVVNCHAQCYNECAIRTVITCNK